MKTPLGFRIILAAVFLALVPVQSLEASPGAPLGTVGAEPAGKDWIVKAENNISGLSDASQLSNPVVVDFTALLDATPEYKKMKDQKISATSPEGIKLNSEAVSRIATQCESIRASNGYCSVWKEIKHRDGRAITDVTDKVKALL